MKNTNIINDTSLVVYNSNKTYNTIELKLKTNHNETIKHYVLLSDELKDITGDVLINHNYQNIGIGYI